MDIAVIIPTRDLSKTQYQVDFLQRQSRSGRVRVFPIEIQAEGLIPTMAKAGRKFRKSDLLMFLRDDVSVLEDGWDNRITEQFRADRYAGLGGFAGATGIGHLNLYKVPYEPQQLLPVNPLDSYDSKRAAFLDSSCLIFTRRAYGEMGGWEDPLKCGFPPNGPFDLYASCRIAEMNYHAWYLPIHHSKSSNGGFKWESDLELIYQRFKETLPLRIFQ